MGTSVVYIRYPVKIRYLRKLLPDCSNTLRQWCNKNAKLIKNNGVRLPSSIPVTIEAKLSSSRMISAACLLTSDPVMPIAIPGMLKINYFSKLDRLCLKRFWTQSEKIKNLNEGNTEGKSIEVLVELPFIFANCNALSLYRGLLSHLCKNAVESHSNDNFLSPKCGP